MQEIIKANRAAKLPSLYAPGGAAVEPLLERFPSTAAEVRYGEFSSFFRCCNIGALII